jgi:2-polyprenyl-3-methyl-5-hydroxy-6-metoxy-1,4-benzoquinol methylase
VGSNPTPSAEMSDDSAHWDKVYSSKPIDQVSWFEAIPRSSLSMIEALGLPNEAPIVDVGGGVSTLAEELLARGHSDVTVVDISEEALQHAREGFPGADRVNWVVADVRNHDLGRRFAVWHDRASFHFMVSAEDREAYLATLERSIEPGGHVIVATFGPEGPSSCSGLPVMRYSADSLAATVAGRAEVVSAHLEDHRTPSGKAQQFLFADLAAPIKGL